MKKKIGLLVVVFVLFGLILGGCVKPASEAPEEVSNVDQADVVVRVMATQTALAKESEEGEDTEAEDAEPTEEASEEATEEPTAEATEEATEEAQDPEPTATAEPVVVATPVGTVPTTYTIHYGEHPYCLARRFDINAEVLLGANGLVLGDQVEPGDVLVIPQNAPPFNGDRVLHTHPHSFTVLHNDTFYSIACYYGDVYPEAIAEANGMTIDEVLVAGTVIQIP